MGFKTTSLTNPKAPPVGGFSLIELMVAVAVGGLVALVVASISLYSGRNFAGLANYADLQTSSLNAIDQMTHDIRQTTGLTSFSSNQLTFANGTNAPLIFVYSPDLRTLTRQQGATRKTLLTQCDSLQFAAFQRTPVAGSWDHYPVGTATNECKVISVTWACSRLIFGLKATTESAQTAQIVIRSY